MIRALGHPIQTMIATFLVIRAAARVAWLEPRLDLSELVVRLKAVPRSCRCDVSLVDGILERLLPVLPPWRAGRCVKRSLVLLDLRSRAGLDPKLHLEFLGEGEARRGHLRVTTDDGAPDDFPLELELVKRPHAVVASPR